MGQCMLCCISTLPADLQSWLRPNLWCLSSQDSVWSCFTLQQGCERVVWRASTWQISVCQLALSSASACSCSYSHGTHGKLWGYVSENNAFTWTAWLEPGNWVLILWNRRQHRYRYVYSCKWATAFLPAVSWFTELWPRFTSGLSKGPVWIWVSKVLLRPLYKDFRLYPCISWNPAHLASWQWIILADVPLQRSSLPVILHFVYKPLLS